MVAGEETRKRASYGELVPVEPGQQQQQQQVGLKRELGLFSAVSMIVAVMIGSGIFLTPSMALEHSGSVGMCLVVWVVCGFLSLLGALAFAELSAVVPRSGAEYAYFMDAYGPLHRYLGQLPAFTCSWVMVFLLRPAEVAIICLTFAENLMQPFKLSSVARGVVPPISAASAGQPLAENLLQPSKINETWDELLQVKLVAVLALGLMVYINISSVKVYVRVQNAFGVFKILACILVIVGGLLYLYADPRPAELLREPFKNQRSEPSGLGNVALAFYAGLWAYDGWSSAAVVAEEVKRPEVNILRSILIAVPIVTVLYVSMNLMYMSALDFHTMTHSTTVGVHWAAMVLPYWLQWAIPVGVALSTFGCGLSIQFGVARLCYVAGREGHVPRFFSWVHFERNTPAAAVALQGLLSLLCMLYGNLGELIELASFLIWAFYGVAMLALIIMRRTKPDARRTYRVPTLVPWLVLLISVFLVVTSFVKAFSPDSTASAESSNPAHKYLFVLAFIALGCTLYHFYVANETKSPFLRKLTYLVQMLFMVVAPDEVEADKEDTVAGY